MTEPIDYISPGDLNMTPSQVRELQDALASRVDGRKVIVLPPGSRVQTVPGAQEAGSGTDALCKLLVEQVRSGVVSIDEARTQLGLEPWGLSETSARHRLSRFPGMAQGDMGGNC